MGGPVRIKEHGGEAMKRKLWIGVLVFLFAGSSAWAVIGGGDISFPAPGMPNVIYSHEAHVLKAKLKCTGCHYQLYTNHAQHKAVGMAGIREGKSCGACHNGSKAFGPTPENCPKCHSRK